MINIDLFLKTVKKINTFECNKIFNTKYLSSYDKEYIKFLEKFGGLSIDNGLFRIHTLYSSIYWTKIVQLYYPKVKDFICFGFDWNGNNYAIDLINKERILMFDYSTGDYFELESSLENFFNIELVNYIDDTLDAKTFSKIKKNINFEQCLAYKKPLFLGGKDTIENLEITDMEVDWDLNYQIIQEIKKLPKSTLIGKINIS